MHDNVNIISYFSMPTSSKVFQSNVICEIQSTLVAWALVLLWPPVTHCSPSRLCCSPRRCCVCDHLCESSLSLSHVFPVSPAVNRFPRCVLVHVPASSRYCICVCRVTARQPIRKTPTCSGRTAARWSLMLGGFWGVCDACWLYKCGVWFLRGCSCVFIVKINDTVRYTHKRSAFTLGYSLLGCTNTHQPHISDDFIL